MTRTAWLLLLVSTLLAAYTAAAAPIEGGTADDPPLCSCVAWSC